VWFRVRVTVIFFFVSHRRLVVLLNTTASLFLLLVSGLNNEVRRPRRDFHCILQHNRVNRNKMLELNKTLTLCLQTSNVCIDIYFDPPSARFPTPTPRTYTLAYARANFLALSQAANTWASRIAEKPHQSCRRCCCVDSCAIY